MKSSVPFAQLHHRLTRRSISTTFLSSLSNPALGGGGVTTPFFPRHSFSARAKCQKCFDSLTESGGLISEAARCKPLLTISKKADGTFAKCCFSFMVCWRPFIERSRVSPGVNVIVWGRFVAGLREKNKTFAWWGEESHLSGWTMISWLKERLCFNRQTKFRLQL